MFKKIFKKLKESEFNPIRKFRALQDFYLKKYKFSNEAKEKDFEMKYLLKKGQIPAEKKEQLKKIYFEKVKKNLELLQKIPNRVKTLSYFDEIWQTEKRIKEIEDFKKAGGKAIGYFCNFVPEELIYAAGCLPIRLCAGFFETVEIGEEILAKDICPLINSSFGAKIAILPYFPLCDLIILPTSCDGKKKLGEILSNWLPVWLLQLPNIKDRDQSKEFWLTEVKILKKRLEKLTQNEITFSKLKKAIELFRQRYLVFRGFFEIRKSSNPVISGRDALLITNTGFFDDIERWTQKTKELCQELKRMREEKLGTKEGCRLLLTGSPIIFPNFKLLNIVEEFGGIIVGDTLCSGTQHFYNPVEINEWTMPEMLKAIAEKYLLPSVCPCFSQSEDRIDNLLQMIKDFKPDGIIYHQLRLCQLYDLEFQKIKQVLSAENIPLLRIQTDYSQEDVEQIKTRVEAFLEMIKIKK